MKHLENWSRNYRIINSRLDPDDDIVKVIDSRSLDLVTNDAISIGQGFLLQGEGNVLYFIHTSRTSHEGELYERGLSIQWVGKLDQQIPEWLKTSLETRGYQRYHYDKTEEKS